MPSSPRFPPDEPGDGDRPDRPATAIETVNGETSPINDAGEGAIEISPIETSDKVTDADMNLNRLVKAVESIETEPALGTVTGYDDPWYTLKELLKRHYPGWPPSRQGLQKKADREHWPKRKRKDSTAYEYHAILP